MHTDPISAQDLDTYGAADPALVEARPAVADHVTATVPQPRQPVPRAPTCARQTSSG